MKKLLRDYIHSVNCYFHIGFVSASLFMIGKFLLSLFMHQLTLNLRDIKTIILVYRKDGPDGRLEEEEDQVLRRRRPKKCQIMLQDVS